MTSPRLHPLVARAVTFVSLLGLAAACSPAEAPAPATAETLPVFPDTLSPAVITDTVPVDSDDPAIWLHPTDPAQSLVLGTDKGDTNGGVYVFGLDGRIDRARSVTPLQRMNNVDVAQSVRLGDVTMDIAVATERNRQVIRVFALPDMRPIDDGGIAVFDGDTSRAPMGVALYRRPADGAVFAIVGGKTGPTDGTYLWQYQLTRDAAGVVRGTKVREFGAYSGRKEIEAIAVDDALGFVYYSDEGVGVRKYHADPDSGTTELALFATTGLVDDHEGLAIFERDASTGYLLLSDQGGGRVQVFAREGMASNPHEHVRLAVIPVRAASTDGLEVTSAPLGERFPAGVLVMMSEPGAFHYYDWRDVQRAIDAVRPAP
jgi:3-phytase